MEVPEYVPKKKKGLKVNFTESTKLYSGNINTNDLSKTTNTTTPKTSNILDLNHIYPLPDITDLNINILNPSSNNNSNPSNVPPVKKLPPIHKPTNISTLTPPPTTNFEPSHIPLLLSLEEVKKQEEDMLIDPDLYISASAEPKDLTNPLKNNNIDKPINNNEPKIVSIDDFFNESIEIFNNYNSKIIEEKDVYNLFKELLEQIILHFPDLINSFNEVSSLIPQDVFHQNVDTHFIMPILESYHRITNNLQVLNKESFREFIKKIQFQLNWLKNLLLQNYVPNYINIEEFDNLLHNNNNINIPYPNDLSNSENNITPFNPDMSDSITIKEFLNDEDRFIQLFFNTNNLDEKSLLVFAPFLMAPMLAEKKEDKFMLGNKYLHLIRTHFDDVVVEGIGKIEKDVKKDEKNNLWPDIKLSNTPNATYSFSESIFYIQFDRSDGEFVNTLRNGKVSILTKDKITPYIAPPIVTPTIPIKTSKKNPPIIPPVIQPKIEHLPFLKNTVIEVKKNRKTSLIMEGEEKKHNCFALTTVYSENNDKINYAFSVDRDKALLQRFLWHFIFSQESIFFKAIIEDSGMDYRISYGRYLIPLTYIELYLFNDDTKLNECSSNCYPDQRIIPRDTWDYIHSYILRVKVDWDKWSSENITESSTIALYQKMIIWFIFCIFFYGFENLTTNNDRLRWLCQGNFIIQTKKL